MGDPDRDAVDELDLAIARAEGHVNGLIEARKLLNGMPLTRQTSSVTVSVTEERVEALPRAVDRLPDVPQSNKPKRQYKAVSKSEDDENRSKVAAILFDGGPMSAYQIANRGTGISEFIIKRITKDHKWFEQANGKISLTTEGHQMVKDIDNGATNE